MVKENDIITDGTTKWKVRRLGGSSDGNPVGTIIMYAANTMPEGYLLCDGSAVSRTDYAKLFEVIGTTWGAGDGSTTFNLPNAVGRFPEGASSVGSYKSTGLPNISGNIYAKSEISQGNGAAGAFSTANRASWNQWMSNTNTVSFFGSVSFLASRSNSTYGNSGTVQPASFTTRYLIKY